MAVVCAVVCDGRVGQKRRQKGLKVGQNWPIKIEKLKGRGVRSMIRRKVYAHIERLRDKVYLGMTYHASEPYAWSLGWYDPQDLTYLLGREPANWEVVPCDLVWDGETLTLVKEGVLTVASLEEVSADTMREIAESKFVPEPDPRPF